MHDPGQRRLKISCFGEVNRRAPHTVKGGAGHLGGREVVRGYERLLRLPMVNGLLTTHSLSLTSIFRGSATGSAPASFLPTDIPLLLASSTGGLETMSFSRTALNSLYADVGLVRPLIQCSEEDGTCDEMRRDVPWRDSQGVWGVRRSSWKYVLDLGRLFFVACSKFVLLIGVPGRCERTQRRLPYLTRVGQVCRILLFNDKKSKPGRFSVVLKSTIFPHWNSDW
jgi:hypothetical protein